MRRRNRRFIPETLFEDRGVRLELEATQGVLWDKPTAYQRVVVFENPTFGMVLTLDGVVQVTERDEFIYHEMMVHVPLLAHQRPRRVLVIGGGDCGIAKQVLKHGSVEYLVQVEIDSGVIEIAKRFFPQLTEPVFNDPRRRFNLVIGDGALFVADTDERFDVIIVDSTDPHGPGEVLFSQKFYADCKQALNPGGVMVTQNGVPFFQPDELTSSLNRLGELFTFSGLYVASVPTYLGGHMAMCCASQAVCMRQVPLHVIESRYRDAGEFPTKYWTPKVHTAAFSVPRFMQDLALLPKTKTI